MRIVTRYEADDGSLWQTESQALGRDFLIGRCQSAEQRLGFRPSSSAFWSGQEFITHRPEDVLEFKQAILSIALGERLLPPGIAERWAQVSQRSDLWQLERAPEPLARLWLRWRCIDEHGREWCSPHYAAQPESSPALGGPA